jgi:non-lysosomal glucosylceramidase
LFNLLEAALRAAEEIARTLNDPTAQAKYHELFARSQASYIKKLWNGEYFRYDTGSEYRDNIQADQLAGQWPRRSRPDGHATQGAEEDFRL